MCRFFLDYVVVEVDMTSIMDIIKMLVWGISEANCKCNMIH